jgi:hypothetical protein
MLSQTCITGQGIPPARFIGRKPVAFGGADENKILTGAPSG